MHGHSPPTFGQDHVSPNKGDIYLESMNANVHDPDDDHVPASGAGTELITATI